MFQSYFLSQQFSLDSMENTVQYGCCAFNEWQYCIDSLIQRQCGPDATKAIQDLINQASGGMFFFLFVFNQCNNNNNNKNFIIFF